MAFLFDDGETPAPETCNYTTPVDAGEITTNDEELGGTPIRVLCDRCYGRLIVVPKDIGSECWGCDGGVLRLPEDVLAALRRDA